MTEYLLAEKLLSPIFLIANKSVPKAEGPMALKIEIEYDNSRFLLCVHTYTFQ